MDASLTGDDADSETLGKFDRFNLTSDVERRSLSESEAGESSVEKMDSTDEETQKIITLLTGEEDTAAKPADDK